MTIVHDTILVTGSREWTDVDTIRAWLIRHLRDGTTRVVHGGARGADDIAGRVAHAHGFIVVPYPVDHIIDGPWPGAGMARNRRMVSAECERARLVYAFSWYQPLWKQRGECGLSRGTGGCALECIKAGLTVTIVAPGSRP